MFKLRRTQAAVLAALLSAAVVARTAFDGGGGVALLIDQLTIAADINSCYSTSDKLRAAHSGGAYLVQRHDNDATQEIGFSGDFVDVASRDSFCSGTTCSIRTFRDQCGAGRDITNTTEANQPVVFESSAGIVAGTVNTPAFRCDGTDTLTRADSSGFSGTEPVAFAFNWARTGGTIDLAIFHVGGTSGGTAWIVFTFNPGTTWGLSAINGNRRYTPVPANTTFANHIGQKASGAQVQQATWETNGTDLAQASLTGGTNVPSLSTTATSLCALSAGSNQAQGVGSTFVTSQALFAGADLTATRAWFDARD